MAPGVARAARRVSPVQVSGGEPDRAGADLTETALLPNVSPAPREIGTPLAGRSRGAAGPEHDAHQLMTISDWPAVRRNPDTGGPGPQ